MDSANVPERVRSGRPGVPKWDSGLQDLDVGALLNHLQDGIAVVDKAGKVLVMNHAAEDTLGATLGADAPEVLEQRVDLRTMEGISIPREQWPGARSRRGEYMQDEELQVVRLESGEVTIARVTTSPLPDAGGEMSSVLFVYRDVTRYRRLDALRQELVSIVESSDDAIVGKDPDGMVTSWNRGAEKIFGFAALEMIGKSIKILLPVNRQEEEEAILARIRLGETVEHTEAERIRKDGSTILVSFTTSPIRDSKGRITGASKVARDITAQRSMERQLQHSQKMEAIGQLTGGIAHDFNNLLGVAIGNLDLLQSMVTGEEVVLRRLQTAQRAALRGADLTRRLLAFSSAEQLRPADTDLGHSIRNTLELAQRGLGPSIKIELLLEEGLPRVFVDGAGLESLLLNLFVNARDAMPEGGLLKVTSRAVQVGEDYVAVKAEEMKPGRYACVAVTDTGCGMSPETLARAAEPFYTTKPRGRGTGLGLSTAYGFLKQSGGKLRIDSELGLGTTVSFYLPLPEKAMVAVEEVARVARPPLVATVLVVDDEEDLLDVAYAYLRSMGCSVLTAVDGEAALNVLESDQPLDLLLTDVAMPGAVSGPVLAEQAVLLRPGLKVVFCSGFPADALLEKMCGGGNFPLLRKPYRKADLEAVVRTALEGGPV